MKLLNQCKYSSYQRHFTLRMKYSILSSLTKNMQGKELKLMS